LYNKNDRSLKYCAYDNENDRFWYYKLHHFILRERGINNMFKRRSLFTLLANIFIFIIFLAYMIMSNDFTDKEKLIYITCSACLLLCCGSVFLTFKSACKTGDYSALAGFNSKKMHNKEILSMMVNRIQDLILYHTLAFNFMLCIFSFFRFLSGLIVFWFILLYVLDFCTIIYYLNYKYKDQLFKNDETQ